MSALRCRKSLLRWAVLLVFLAFFAQLTFGSVQLSLTSDEPPHIAHGYVMLTTGDTWALLDHRHPPLMNVLSVLPLLLQPERPDAHTLPHWGTDFILFVRELWPLLGPVDRLAFVTRYPNMLIGVLLMALVYRWARERFGREAGWLAIAVMAFDPTMIAHAQLNTTDLGMAFFAFACLYLALQPAHRASWLNLAGIGATLGAALAAKGSGVMLVPVVVALVGWRAWGRKQEAGSKGEGGRANGRTIQPPNPPRSASGTPPPNHPTTQSPSRRPGDCATQLPSRIAHLASCFLFSVSFILLVAVLVLWGSYGFRLEPLSQDVALRVPLVSHAKMVLTILSEKARTAFLWGDVRTGGWWWYFLVAIALKTPVPILVLALWALLSGVFGARRLPVNGGAGSARFGNRGYIDFAFWLFPAFYFIVAIRSGMNIGYRHLLPVFPFVYVAIGRIANEKLEIRNEKAIYHVSRITYHVSRFTHHVSRFTLYVLLLWLIIGTLRVYPFAIAYFNELAGGPRNGYHYLVDSNVDWGQSFKALKAWMDATGTAEVRLSYYTWIDPAAYGVHYRPLPPAQDAGPLFDRRYDPEPGVYAISATPLQGVMVADTDMYDWFRHRDPVAQPGYGLLVYDVVPHPVSPQWLAQCSAPVAPLTPEAIAPGFGRDDLRLLTFDCTQSWVYPDGGDVPGWYVLHADVAHAGDPFLQARLDAAKLSYEQRKPGDLPPFALFEQGRGALSPAVSSGVPVEFGALAFLGYTVSTPSPASPGATLAIETWWRVDALPDRALSLMLHLVGPDGAPVIVGDGLGVPLESWQMGDLIVQRHMLPIPADAPAGSYTPHIGVYWLDTLERWPVTSGVPAGADNLALPPVTVE